MAQPVPIDVDLDDESPPRRGWIGRALIVLVALGLLVAAIVAVRGWMATPDAPRRQVAKIAILPDTPPPPPPPPKEEPKKEPPKEELRTQTQPLPQQKPDDTPPAPAPIKMEGAAGDGPSPFSAGAVSNEYKAGAPTVGGAVTAGQGGTASDRAQERFYANSVRQLLREGIERNLRAEAGELTATFAIWVEVDGSLTRFEITPSGDAARDGDLRSALEATSRTLKLPPPGGLGQPMRFRLTVRALG